MDRSNHSTAVLVETEPIVDERLRTFIDDELKVFGVKQGASTKTIEDLNTEFIKKNANSVPHRAEGTRQRMSLHVRHTPLPFSSRENHAADQSIEQSEGHRISNNLRSKFRRSKFESSSPLSESPRSPPCLSFFQVCSNIYENMQAGDYGSVESPMLEKYRADCQRIWPKANLFQLNSSSPPPSYASFSTSPPPYSSDDTQSNDRATSLDQH